MAVTAGDIKFYLSGGAGNSNHDASLGGVISSTQVSTNTLFDDVSAGEASAGDTEYRCIYVKNTNGTDTLTAAKVFIQANTTGNRIALALGGEGVNGTAETVANENSAPSGESFTQPTDYTSGLSMGNLAAGAYYPIWVRRTIPSSAAAGTDTYTIRVQGEG